MQADETSGQDGSAEIESQPDELANRHGFRPLFVPVQDPESSGRIMMKKSISVIGLIAIAVSAGLLAAWRTQPVDLSPIYPNPTVTVTITPTPCPQEDSCGYVNHQWVPTPH